MLQFRITQGYRGHQVASTMAAAAVSSNVLLDDTPSKESCHVCKKMHHPIRIYELANSSSGDCVQSLIWSFDRMPQLRRCSFLPQTCPDLGINLRPEVHWPLFQSLRLEYLRKEVFLKVYLAVLLLNTPWRRHAGPQRAGRLSTAHTCGDLDPGY